MSAIVAYQDAPAAAALELAFKLPFSVLFARVVSVQLEEGKRIRALAAVGRSLVGFVETTTGQMYIFSLGDVHVSACCAWACEQTGQEYIFVGGSNSAGKSSIFTLCLSETILSSGIKLVAHCNITSNHPYTSLSCYDKILAASTSAGLVYFFYRDNNSTALALAGRFRADTCGVNKVLLSKSDFDGSLLLYTLGNSTTSFQIWRPRPVGESFEFDNLFSRHINSDGRTLESFNAVLPLPVYNKIILGSSSGNLYSFDFRGDASASGAKLIYTCSGPVTNMITLGDLIVCSVSGVGCETIRLLFRDPLEHPSATSVSIATDSEEICYLDWARLVAQTVDQAIACDSLGHVFVVPTSNI